MSEIAATSYPAAVRRVSGSSLQSDIDGRPTEPLSHALSTLTVLLVGNYSTDQQHSMQLFADLLVRELPGSDSEPRCKVEMIRPEPLFGRLKPGAAGFGKWLGYADKFALFP